MIVLKHYSIVPIEMCIVAIAALMHFFPAQMQFLLGVVVGSALLTHCYKSWKFCFSNEYYKPHKPIDYILGILSPILLPIVAISMAAIKSKNQ